MLTTNLSYAQYYKFDNSVAVEAAYSFIDITNGTKVLLGDDAVSGSIPIGFTFNFGGINYTSVNLSSNGVIFFVGNNTAYINRALNNTGFATNTVAMFPFWDDFYSNGAGGSGEMYYKTIGSAPNRTFIISFVKVAHYDARKTISDIQVQINEDGTFVYKYGSVYLNGASATVGIMVKNSSDINQYSFNTNNSITNGTTILWTLPAPDHYEIEFTPNNSGLTCKPQDIIVRACSNGITPCTAVANQSTSPYSISLNTNLGTFTGGFISKPVTFTGNTTDKLTSLNIGTATLSVTGATTGNPALRCYSGATLLGSCQTSFAETGLFFDWQTNPKTAADEGILDAGATSQIVKLSAVRKSDNSNSCTGFVPGASPNMSISYSDPNTGSRSISVTPTNAAGTGATAYNVGTAPVAVPFVWGANGETYFKMNYFDSGKININASIVNPTANGTKTLISKPNSIRAYNTASDSVCADGTVMGVTTNKFCKSGETFTTKVRGYATDGTTLPNFGLESAVSTFVMSGSLISPAGGNSSNISNITAGSSGTLSGGVTVTKNRACTGADCYLLANLAWDNVGEISLLPTITGDNYFGAGPITSKPLLPFGRFYPFGFTPSSPSIINRVAASCPAASSFTYMGEDFRGLINLIAVNKAGGITTNYDGTRMNPALASSWSVKAVEAVPLTSRITFNSSTGSWASGVFNGSLTLNLGRLANPDGPYNNAKVGISPVDTDGVIIPLAAYNMDADLNTVNDSYSLGATNFYFGRLKIGNAVGSDILPLPVSIETQFFNNFGFTANTQDSCTLLTNAQFINSNYTQNITSPETTFTYPGRFISGKQTLLLNKPSGGDGLYNGTFDVSYDLVADSKQYLLGKWTGLTYTENPKGKLVLAKNPGKKGLLYFKENY